MSKGAICLGVSHDSAPPSVRPPRLQDGRRQIVVARREARAGETHEHAAQFDERDELVARRAGGNAHVGEHEHGRLFREQRDDRIARRVAPFANFGEGRQRALDVIRRRQQRLRDVGAGAGENRDPPSPRAFVDEPDRARRSLVGDDDPGDLIAQFDRQIETRFGRPRRAEVERRFADRAALGVESAREAGFARIRAGARQMGLEGPGEIVDAGDADRRRAIGDEGNRVAASGRRQAAREGAGAAEVDSVGDPDDLGLRIGVEETLDRRQRRLARRRIGNGRQRAQFFLDARAVERRDVEPACGNRQHGREAPSARRAAQRVARVCDAALPGRRRRPAVVDQQEQRAGAGAGGFREVPDRPRHRQDDQGGDRDPQRQQGPRRLGRRRIFRIEAEQQAQRREHGLARSRRRDLEKNIERGEEREGGQNRRRGEGEGQAEHRQALQAFVAGSGPASRARSASSACAAD